MILRKLARKIINSFGYQIARVDRNYPVTKAIDPIGVDRNYPITKAIDPIGVEVLADRDFQASVEEVSKLTLLDTSRLANLWQLCRLSSASGNILEVGTYRGGAAVHCSNSCPGRKIIICDSFQGFEALDPDLDTNFDRTMFRDSRKNDIEALFRSRNSSFEIIEGFFPDSCRTKEIRPLSFVHLDVDTYKSTRESLFYLADQMVEKSLIVLDDYFRKADGVNKAVLDFTSSCRDWACFPMFPGQGLLVHRSWFGVRDYS